MSGAVPRGSREPTADECAGVLPALGVTSVGRARALVPVASRAELAASAPDFEEPRVACDRLGLLGCHVCSVPTHTGRISARMSAQSIGVPEDIADANSTTCPAADLTGRGVTEIAVDMGGSPGGPATLTASARPVLRLGGVAESPIP